MAEGPVVLALTHVTLLVLDEADRLLELGFEDDVKVVGRAKANGLLLGTLPLAVMTNLTH